MLEIDLVMLVRENLNINEYLTLVKAYNNLNGEDLPFSSTQQTLNNLELNGWLKSEDGGYQLTKKAIMLVGEEAINFDEMFNLYPTKTPDGRILRAANKEFNGKLTADYKKLRDKYLKKIKNVAMHEMILDATSKMLSDYKKRGSLNYLPLMETFVNQSQWERYIGEDVVQHIGNGNTERL